MNEGNAPHKRFDRILLTGGSGFLGTNLVEHFAGRCERLVNYDVAPPRFSEQHKYWFKGDLLQAAALRDVARDLKPTLILHFGARTDLGGKTLDDYKANTQGVQNVIDAAHAAGSVERIIFCSSMLVCRLGYLPASVTDYCPDTVYGESKVIGEQIVRALPPSQFSWTILRPTSIWGPWFAIPYRSFFDAVTSGLYRHPGGVRVLRTYGFVLNAIAQTAAITEAPDQLIQGSTLYLGDYEPTDVKRWADSIGTFCRGKPVDTWPLGLFRIAAKVGDLLQKAGIQNVPMSSFRLKNMLTNAQYDLSGTRRICDQLPYTLEEGVKITLKWLADNRRSA